MALTTVAKLPNACRAAWPLTHVVLFNQETREGQGLSQVSDPSTLAEAWPKMMAEVQITAEMGGWLGLGLEPGHPTSV